MLYDLHCIDRFFPPTVEGSALQHVTLDRAGARTLGLENWKKLDALPLTFRHTVLAGEFRIQARRHGFPWGTSEHSLGPVVADVYYPRERMAVEIDTGTESHTTLKEKATRYKRIRGLGVLLIVTTGPRERLKTFLDGVDGVAERKAGARFERLPELLAALAKKEQKSA